MCLSQLALLGFGYYVARIIRVLRRERRFIIAVDPQMDALAASTTLYEGDDAHHDIHHSQDHKIAAVDIKLKSANPCVTREDRNRISKLHAILLRKIPDS